MPNDPEETVSNTTSVPRIGQALATQSDSSSRESSAADSAIVEVSQMEVPELRRSSRIRRPSLAALEAAATAKTRKTSTKVAEKAVSKNANVPTISEGFDITIDLTNEELSSSDVVPNTEELSSTDAIVKIEEFSPTYVVIKTEDYWSTDEVPNIEEVRSTDVVPYTEEFSSTDLVPKVEEFWSTHEAPKIEEVWYTEEVPETEEFQQYFVVPKIEELEETHVIPEIITLDETMPNVQVPEDDDIQIVRRSSRPRRLSAAGLAAAVATRKPVKVTTHRLYNEYYVLYTIKRSDGSIFEASEFEIKKHIALLDTYRHKLTGQKNGVGEYEVKKILAHRLVQRRGKPEKLYLVEWEGYSDPVWFSEMWEDELLGSKDLLEQYSNEPFETFH